MRIRMTKSNGHPKQLCPAPRCKGLAAPVFGMLCTRHKDAPKRTVKKWREVRRARNARAS